MSFEFLNFPRPFSNIWDDVLFANQTNPAFLYNRNILKKSQTNKSAILQIDLEVSIGARSSKIYNSIVLRNFKSFRLTYALMTSETKFKYFKTIL